MTVLHQIDPIALDLGTWNLPVIGSVHPQIHWYGLMYLIAFVAAWWLGQRRVRAGRLPGVNDQAFGDLVFYGALGVVLGGRLGYILFYDLPAYIDQPLQVFKIWQGGMSFHGGLLGVVIAAWWWSRRQGLHLFDTVDFVAPLVPPGLGLGRIGNFINGELWGKPTEAGWGMVFPTAPEFQGWTLEQIQTQFASGALDQYARHPSQLYQAGLEGAGDVRGAVVVLAQAAAALCGVGSVRAALRRVSLCRRIRARARYADRLPRLRLADDGAVAEPAADRDGHVPVVAVAAFADAAAGVLTGTGSVR